MEGVSVILCCYNSAERLPKTLQYLANQKIVVEKSTLPVRTAQAIQNILDNTGNSVKFEILSNPEFLDYDYILLLKSKTLNTNK